MKVLFMISSYTNGSENKTDFKVWIPYKCVCYDCVLPLYKDGIILFYV